MKTEREKEIERGGLYDPERPEDLPSPVDGTIHVASNADGSEVLVYGPGVVIRFEPRQQLDAFIKLLQKAQEKALTQQYVLKNLEGG